MGEGVNPGVCGQSPQPPKANGRLGAKPSSAGGKGVWERSNICWLAELMLNANVDVECRQLNASEDGLMQELMLNADS